MQNEIITKLNAFIRKYYKNLVVRGIIYTLLLLIVFFVALNVIEYFGWTSTTFRSIVFYSYLLLTLFVVCYWIIFPLFKLFRIGKTLSYSQAAKIIGNYFSDIQDKLLNLLQLQEIAKTSDNELLSAAIEQKTRLLSPVPFQKAVDTSKTKQFSKYLIVVLIAVGILAFAFPRLFSEPSKRYINHNTFYEKPAPFSFKILSPLKAVQQSDYNVKVQVSGKMLPEKVNVIVNGQRFEMKKEYKTHFSYIISQIQATSSVQFEAADVYSKVYNVIVNPKPILTDLTAEIIYPPYTKIKNETINNVTDLSLPKGTKIVWHLKTKDCQTVIMTKRNETPNAATPQTSTSKEITLNKKGSADIQETYLNSTNIVLKTKNNFTVSSDSIAFNINTIADEKPFIAVIEQKDSIIIDNIYFRGQIKDDYGFSKLEFHLKVTPSGSNVSKIHTKRLTITENETAQEFYHMATLGEYDVHKGDKVDYWFEIWDNDAINGAKSTKSQTFVINIPSEQQIDSQISQNSEDIRKQADKTIDEIKRLQNEIKELTRKLTEKKELSWQDEKDLNDIKHQQNDIKQKIDDIKQKINENTSLEEKYKDTDPELIEKQKQIEDLFNQLQNKDLEDLLKQLDNLINKNFNKDQINEQLNKISKKNEDISKQLDKNLEMYKRLDVEKDINDNIEKLRQLAEKQKQLSEETKNTKSSKQDKQQNLQKRQQDLNNEFKDLQKKMDETKRKDAQLETPFNVKQDKQKENQIQNQQQKANDNLKNNNNKNASKNQQQAAEQMQQMAEDMEQQLDERGEEQLGEDIDDVRSILKNLVTLSKKQEDLIYSTQNTTTSNPEYQKIINSQNTIKESMQTISDSLYAISKRQPQVSKVINDETFKVKENIDKSLESLLFFNQSYYTNYKNSKASTSQQYSMSSMNNLALLLAESLDNMNKQQQQMKSNKKNNSKNAKNQCNNPSQGKQGKSAKSMRELQEALNKEIERLSKELEKRGNKSSQKIGENSEINERLAKAAAQQGMIRQMMQQYLQELKQEGGKAVGEMNKALKDMENTEKDIVNKRINSQTLNRQKQILTRMLESEKAEMKKGKEEKRESKSGIDKRIENNKEFEEFKKLKNRDMELLRKIPPVYSSYYKTKISEYFSNFETSNANIKNK